MIKKNCFGPNINKKKPLQFGSPHKKNVYKSVPTLPKL